MVFIFLSLLLASCQIQDVSTPTSTVELLDASFIEVPTDTTVPPTATFPVPTSTLEPTPKDVSIPRPQYVISAILDYGWRLLTVDQEITYQNSYRESITELSLVVQTNWRPDVFTISNLSWEDGTPIENYSLEGIQLIIPLNESLQPGQVIKLSLTYELSIPPIVTSEDWGPNPFGYTSRQINLTDWYPFIPPYIDGEGWLVHNPWYYGEHLVYPVADFDVTIKITNAPGGTIIAASTLAEVAEDSYHYRMDQTRNFVWSVSPEYRVFQDKVGEITVLGYAFPYDILPGEAAFKTTLKALELYQSLFGPYPFDALTGIQADFEHGMEYSGLYFLSKAFYSTYDGSTSTYLVTIAAHETAHQWWYGRVGNDQALEPWLDEALCTYSEKLFYENLYPASMSWWDYARVAYYEPAGWVDGSIYNTTGYRPYRDAVYLNGALFLDELRGLVGDEDFFDFLSDYVGRKTNQLATADDFFAILRLHTDADWSELSAKYFENTHLDE